MLIDTSVAGTAGAITRAGCASVWTRVAAGAILLTHGHFDHVGAVKKLAEEWDVSVYAHPLEHPFLNGTSSYPLDRSDSGGWTAFHLVPALSAGAD